MKSHIPSIPQDFRFFNSARNVLKLKKKKTPSVMAENENNVLTITGAVPLTTACFGFQDKGDVNVFTAHFPQNGEPGAGGGGAGKPTPANPTY